MMQDNYRLKPASSSFSVTDTITSSNDILSMLEQQLDNFPTIKNLVSSKDLCPGNIFLPQTLKLIEQELTFKEEIIVELITFLDIINNYSFIVYGDNTVFLDNIIDNIVFSRTVSNSIKNLLAKDSLDDYIFSTREDAIIFINDNKLILGIYIYSLLYIVFYKGNS